MAGSEHTSFTEKSWNLGPSPIIEEVETIEAGQVLAAQQPVGRVTGSGAWKLSVPGAGDGSEVVRGFTPEPIDASGGAVDASIIKQGRFDEDAVDLTDTTHTKATIKVDLEGTPLFIANVLNTSV